MVFGIIGVVVLIIVLLIAAYIGIYNGLVVAKQKVKNAWSQIEVQLQKRFDLVPNLVETVKGYAKHEKEVLDKVTELRSSWASAKTNSEKVEVENQFAGALKTIMAVAENYPELKASENFLNLQKNLTKMEDQLQAARRLYNTDVTSYNTTLQTFPSNIIAGFFGFKEEELFQLEPGKEQNVNVEL